MSAYWHVGAVEVAVAKEALIAYFESVKGRGAIVMYSGHGDGTGSWCMTDGRISYLDVLHWWQGVDATIGTKDKNYHLGTLTIISDCCHSGQWAQDAAWHYAEMRGRGGVGAEEVKKRDPTDKYEYLERVFVQAACDKDRLTPDAAFAPAFCQMQTEPTPLGPSPGWERFGPKLGSQMLSLSLIHI